MYTDENFFTKLKNSLVNTRRKLKDGLFVLFRDVKKIDASLLSKLEDQLLISDVGVHTTQKIIDHLVLRYSSINTSNINQDICYDILREEMFKILSSINHPLRIDEAKKPFVILVVGVNGVGKTTLIGKLAYRYRNEKKKVLLGAADTFRAAAVEQLQMISLQSDVAIISQKFCTDPASIVFDSIQCAKSQLMDVVIIDTAGRLQNKNNLMYELKKIVRVVKKFDITAPHEIMIVLDATIGQNSLNQVDLFNKFVGITGIVMSKLDGTSKGGVLFSIVDKFGIPIRYISFGKNIFDLDLFNVSNFIKSIFD